MLLTCDGARPFCLPLNRLPQNAVYKKNGWRQLLKFVITFIPYLTAKTTYSERELVLLLKEQSNGAFNYLYDHYAAALYTIICQIVNDRETANDVLQEVFVNIWKKISLYDESRGRLFTWMLNIARNAAIDKVRSRGFRDHQKNQPVSETVNQKNMPGVMPVFQDVGLRKVLAGLNEEYRKLIDFSYFQGFTHEEIAQLTGLPLGTVKTKIRMAIGQLRNMIKQPREH
jgi:RNA polymerase sigma factor (sigma-70 family)